MVPNVPATQIFFVSGAAMPQKLNSASWVPNGRAFSLELFAGTKFIFTAKSNIIVTINNLKILITVPLFEKI
jgi:hypothetical protein